MRSVPPVETVTTPLPEVASKSQPAPADAVAKDVIASGLLSVP